MTGAYREIRKSCRETTTRRLISTVTEWESLVRGGRKTETKSKRLFRESRSLPKIIRKNVAQCLGLRHHPSKCGSSGQERFPVEAGRISWAGSGRKTGQMAGQELPGTRAAEDLGIEANPLELFLRMEDPYQIIDFDRRRGGSPPVESSTEREPEFRKAGEGEAPVSGPNGLSLTGNELSPTRFSWISRVFSLGRGLRQFHFDSGGDWNNPNSKRGYRY